MGIAIKRLNQFFIAQAAAVTSAVVDEKALAAQYVLSDFRFTLTNRAGLEIKRSIRAYTVDHALDLLKKQNMIPRGYRVASKSGRAVRKPAGR